MIEMIGSTMIATNNARKNRAKTRARSSDICARAVREAKESNARKSRAFYFCDWCQVNEVGGRRNAVAAIPNGLFRRGRRPRAGRATPPSKQLSCLVRYCVHSMKDTVRIGIIGAGFARTT